MTACARERVVRGEARVEEQPPAETHAGGNRLLRNVLEELLHPERRDGVGTNGIVTLELRL